MDRILRVGLLLGCLASIGCGGKMPETIGLTGGALAPCPSSPNCVASDATDEQHAIEPLMVSGSVDAAWAALGKELVGREDVEIVSETGDYVHAVFTTPLMRYRDDVEFQLRANQSAIAVRSASRVGYGDMDANRDRVEAIRLALEAQGLVKKSINR